MQQSEDYKKKIIGIGIGCIFVIGVVFLISYCEYRAYTRYFNQKWNRVYEYLEQREENFDGLELLELLESNQRVEKDYFLQYGIDLTKNSVMDKNDKTMHLFLGVNCGVALFFCLLLTGAFYVGERRRREEIARIAKYLKNINDGDYYFDIDGAKEGEMSILETEVYKSTIMLREAADQSKADKERLKESLSDISHQLKTPLTSLMINLDNLGQNPQMEEALKMKLIRNAKRDTGRLSMMVQQLLTLSKIDANVIEFRKEKCSLESIVREAVESVEALAELKGIELLFDNEKDGEAEIMCDSYWQTQAIGNILKNGLEHAQHYVKITYLNYELHKEIIIENDGKPIGEKDRKNLFQRYYSGENSTSDSVGIGLALAHAVIRQDGGYITVECDEREPQKGVKFIVKYLR